MKVISEKQVKGKTRTTVLLNPGEKLMVFRPGKHYRLGYPVEDIVASHVLEDKVEVSWCSASQAWVD